MMVVPWVLLLVVIVVAVGMIGWLKTTKKGQCTIQNRTSLINHVIVDLTDLADRRGEQIKESGAVEGSVYDEVKPNCAETAISLKSNIAYTTVKHTSVL